MKNMKVFLSWSGSLSLAVAKILEDYLPLMINDIEPFLSKHIESGSRWNLELARGLEESSFGILCLTSENLKSDWLLFEAGALTKHVEGRACGLLIGSLRPSDISGPLSQFQHRIFSKEELYGLLKDINAKLKRPLEVRLDFIVDQWWPKIETEYHNALDTTPSDSKRVPRDQRDILEEILGRVRGIEKTLLTPTLQRSHHIRIKGDQPNITNFIRVLQNVDFGGRPTVFQQYSPNLAAVNVQSEHPIDITKLSETAKECGVELEILEM
jgi:hypothetical protein